MLNKNQERRQQAGLHTDTLGTISEGSKYGY